MNDLIEENRDALETVYYSLYAMAMEHEGFHDESNRLWKVWKTLDGALVNLGILEGDENDEKATD